MTNSSTLAADGQPGRTTRMPRLARRAQLLESAEEVFVERGYHAAGMDEIAARAGVSKPVLYQHFPGKLELYMALLDRSAEDFLGQVKTALASTTDNKLRVIAAVHTYFAYIGDASRAHRLLFENDLLSEPAVRDRVAQVLDDCADEVSAVIQEDTGLSPAESKLLAVGLVGMAQVSARYWLSTEGGITADHAMQLAATLGWRGIRGFPRRDEGDAQ